MSTKTPRLPKHHYLPEFYLKGFEIEGSRQCFWKYEKSKGRITPPRPIAATEFFYERGTNTFEDLQKDPEAVEKSYSALEGRIKPVHEAIISGGMTKELFEEYLFFIIFLYFRMPVNEALVNKITENMSPNQLGYRLRNKNTGKHVSVELEKEITDAPYWKRLGQSFLATGMVMHQIGILEKVYRHTSVIKTKNIVLSDAPVIFPEMKGFEYGITEFIFPMDRDHSLIHSKGNHQPFESERFDSIKDTQLARQAHEFIVCTDKDYLNQLMLELATESH